MAFQVKAGVNLEGVKLRLLDDVRTIVTECYSMLDRDCVVTSGNDGTHSGRPVVGTLKDPHYEGLAIDIRTKNVPIAARESLWIDIKAALGPEYVVLWENPGKDNEHFHVQLGHIEGR